MKNLHLWRILVLMTCVVIFQSCGSNDEDDLVDLSSVIGLWVCTASTDSWEGGTTTDYMVDQMLMVNADGTYYSTSKDMGYEGKWRIAGNSFSATSNSGRIFNAIVTVNSTTLKMKGSTNDGYSFNYTFKRLDPDDLEITDDENQQQNPDSPTVNPSLEGTWRGNMYISTYYQGRTYNATYTEITFVGDPYSLASGKGYWVDYYSNAPWKYVACHIQWTADNSTIYIDFVEDGTRMTISDYHQKENRFYGTLKDNGGAKDFELYHTTTPDFSSYNWGYEDWGNEDWYY